MAKRTLYLVRHGQEDRDKSADEFGGPLTALGRRQARSVARRLAGFPIRTIHHSDYFRAAETARIVAARLLAARLHKTALLRETVPGRPTHDHPYFDQFTPEQLAQGQRAVDEAFAKFFKPSPGQAERHEALVCHGNVIRYLMCLATENSPRHWRHWDVNNCGLCVVVVNDERECMVLAHNDTGHIPRGCLTFI